jgi:internalin A
MKNVYKVMVLLGSAPFFGSALPVQSSTTETTKDFTQWCLQKNSVSIATRRTIDILLANANTDNCQEADSKLRSLTRLNLHNSKISDLQPLNNFHNLKWLFLSNNQINDLRPLANLSNLQSLFLDNNQITDLKPLANLKSLTVIALSNNKISDAAPLTRLRSQARIYLDGNPAAIVFFPPQEPRPIPSPDNYKFPSSDGSLPETSDGFSDNHH